MEQILVLTTSDIYIQNANQAVQQPKAGKHPKQLHSTCTSTCTCTCAAVQVETFATVREAVKYYLAEFFSLRG